MKKNFLNNGITENVLVNSLEMLGPFSALQIEFESNSRTFDSIAKILSFDFIGLKEGKICDDNAYITEKFSCLIKIYKLNETSYLFSARKDRKGFLGYA